MAAVPLLTTGELEAARCLVESQGLAPEDGCDEVVGIYECGRLVATAARAGCVLKLFAIDEACQGGGALGELATVLVQSGRRAGHDALFVYTRPEHAASFEQCNFRLLVATRGVALLEWGGGLERYVGRLAQLAADLPRRSREPAPAGGEAAKAGAVVLNGNPFTLGHQYLLETAAARVERLFVFVVREEGSTFSFADRYRMAEAGTRPLPNVSLLDTSRYAVSAATFPSYFLRTTDDRARLQMEVDARLFGRHIAPAAGIACRFVGHEPYCGTTAAYNEVMSRVLPEYGIDLVEIERARDGPDTFVSATRVRAALAAGDMETVARLVPATTLAILRETGNGKRRTGDHAETGPLI